MKKYLILLIICSALNTAIYAQKSLSQGPNANAVDKSAIMGNYEIDKNNVQRRITEHINVNYKLSSMPFKNLLHLEIRTSDPTFFTADIIDSKGIKLMHWAPSSKSYSYRDDIDIAKLPAGNYQLVIANEITPDVPKSISFEKAANN